MSESNIVYPVNIINIVRRAERRCSFCHCQGHNISTCNDQRFINFEEECINKKNDIYRENGLPNAENTFVAWLANRAHMDPTLVKGFAVRKCRSLTRNNINSHIAKIVNYIFRQQHHQLNQPNQPDQPDQPAQPVISLFNRPDLPLNNIFDDYEIASVAEMLLSISNRIDRSNSVQSPRTRMYEILRGQILDERISLLRSIYMLRELSRMLYENSRSNQNIPENRKFEIVLSLEITEDVTELEENIDCAICYEAKQEKHFVALNCGHKFCSSCLKTSLQKCNHASNPCCALCRCEIKNIISKDDTTMDEFTDLIL